MTTHTLEKVAGVMLSLAMGLAVFSFACFVMAVYAAITGPTSWWPLAVIIPLSLLAALAVAHKARSVL